MTDFMYHVEDWQCGWEVKIRTVGVPAVAKRDQQRLWSNGKRFPSPAQHSGLRTQHCHSYSIGCICSSDLAWELHVLQCGQKKKKKNGSQIVVDSVGHRRCHEFPLAVTGSQ